MALELSPKYRRVLETGEFRELLRPDPWPHFVLDDFIEAADFAELQRRIVSEPVGYARLEDHPARLELAYLKQLDLAEFFFSKPVRRLFEGVAQTPLRPNANLAIQIRRVTPESPAFPPHIDLNEAPSLVALYYVSPGWTPACGGELNLLTDELTDVRTSGAKRLAPIANRLVLFLSEETHWHSVSRVNGWTRLMVLTEWLKGDQ